MTRWRMVLGATLCASACVSGCGNRAIVVPPGEPLRLRETLRDVKVWVAGADGTEIPVKADLPEGWYVLPDVEPDSLR